MSSQAYHERSLRRSNRKRFCYYQSMNMHLPKHAKDIKGAVAIAELQRAHYIIVILALAFAAIVALTSAFEAQLDAIMSFLLVVLLGCVALISLFTAIRLHKK